mgnify:FL=1
MEKSNRFVFWLYVILYCPIAFFVIIFVNDFFHPSAIIMLATSVIALWVIFLMAFHKIEMKELKEAIDDLNGKIK